MCNLIYSHTLINNNNIVIFILQQYVRNMKHETFKMYIQMCDRSINHIISNKWITNTFDWAKKKGWTSEMVSCCCFLSRGSLYWAVHFGVRSPTWSFGVNTQHIIKRINCALLFLKIWITTLCMCFCLVVEIFAFFSFHFFFGMKTQQIAATALAIKP